jgi:hypothetical protein
MDAGVTLENSQIFRIRSIFLVSKARSLEVED